MSIPSLRSVLDRVETNRVMWLAPHKHAYSAGEIRQLLANGSDVTGRAAGKNVSLLARSESELAYLLVLLDGICAQLTLLPEVTSHDALRQIIRQAGTKLLVTTDPEATTLTDAPVEFVDLESLSDGTADTSKSLTPPQLATRWVLPTSGTTGQPKLIAHSLASLIRTAKHDVERGGRFRWGALYNLTGFAGLQVFLQSWCGGSCLILRQPDSSLEQQVANLIAGGCNALSATPTMWRKLLMSSPIDKLPLKQITLGGEIVDSKILTALRQIFPDANIVHIYASTEAGVGFAVRDGLAGFPASYLDAPPPGLRIAVTRAGRLLLRSECDEQEYLHNASRLKRDDGFIDTGDLVRREGDRFLFLGRANGTINVGGNKVHPEEVENFLLGCEGVQLARVSAKQSPFTGSLVSAEVVPDGSCAANRDELRKRLLARCREELEPFKVPAVLRIVSTIETTNSGKVKRAT